MHGSWAFRRPLDIWTPMAHIMYNNCVKSNAVVKFVGHLRGSLTLLDFYLITIEDIATTVMFGSMS
jgi:hypothetical protein